MVADYLSNKAFHSVSRARMELILSSYGIPRKIVKAIMFMYLCTSATVITPDGQTDPFDITASVLQGGTLSPFLFVIVVDYMMRLTVPDTSVGFRWKRCEGFRRPAGHIADLDYADDVVLWPAELIMPSSCSLPLRPIPPKQISCLQETSVKNLFSKQQMGQLNQWMT